MHWFDIFISVLLLVSCISGFRMGLIYKIGSLVGCILGIWIASRVTASSIDHIGLGTIRSVGTFFLVLTLVRWIVSWIAYVIQKVFNLVAIIPGLRTLNRLGGAVMSVIVSFFVISSVLYVANELAPRNAFVDTIHEAPIANRLVKLSAFYKPFIANRLHDVFDKVQESL